MKTVTSAKERWALKNFLGLLLCSQLVLSSGFSNAQGPSGFSQGERTVSGVVYDESNLPLPGVSVVVKGTTRGTTTDLDGKFSIALKQGDEVLQFSFVGMKSQEVTPANQTQIVVTLMPDLQGLEEVVVIGYGVQKKKDLSGSVASVKVDDLSKVKATNPLQALQGLVPGVSVTSNSGTPGAGATINIRGITTLNNNSPLFIIDGIPGDFTNIASDEIESITVLKDASAAAIYGARAAGGVVFVQTRRGKVNSDFKVFYSNNTAMQQVVKLIDMCNPEEYKKVYAMIAATDVVKTDPAAVAGASIVGEFNGVQFAADDYAWNYDRKENGVPVYGNTNWQKEMFRQAWQQQHTIGIVGGGQNSNISISANYAKQDGVMIGSDFERKGVRVNSDLQKGRLKVGESFSFSRKNGRNLVSSGYGQTYDMLYALPHIPVYNSQNLGGFSGYYNGMPIVKNPVGNALIPKSDYSNDFLVANGYAEVDIVSGLKYKINGGFTSESYYDFYFKPKYFMSTIDQEQKGYLSETRSRYDYWIIENLLTYQKSFGNHSFDALVGYSAEEETSRNLYGKAEGFNYQDLPVLSLGLENKEVNSKEISSTMVSMFGRVNYSYMDKYLLQANFRSDGSSKFGSENRYGLFPSFSAAWHISKENFFSVGAITDLKLRASYGLIGNDRIGDYRYTQYVSGGFYYPMGYDQHQVLGMRGYNLANEGIKWETTSTADVGLDLAMFNSRFTLSADLYKKRTEDILVNVSLPLSFGGEDSQLLNAATVENNGIELVLNWREAKNDFSYGIMGTFSTSSNKVVDLGGNNEPAWGGDVDYNSGSVTRTKVGGSISEFTVYKTNGIFQSLGEVNGYVNDDGDLLQPFAQPGDIRFIDANGDGVIDQEDKVKVGSPLPDFEYSFSFNAAYKEFDVSFMFTGVYGNKIFNGIKYITESMKEYRNYSTNAIKAWTPQNTNTNIPRAVKDDPNGNSRVSDRFVEDGSYFRLKTIQVGYSLPPSLLAKIKVDAVRIYVGANNVFTITGYSGYSPEIVGGDIYNRGIDFGSYPLFRNMNFGVEIKF
jgi:TonB-linked SusC/RagA family outer membrane protein